MTSLQLASAASTLGHRPRGSSPRSRVPSARSTARSAARGEERGAVDAPRRHAASVLWSSSSRSPTTTARSKWSAPPRRDRRTPIRPVGSSAPGSALAAAARLAQRDHGGGGVLADVLAARAVAVPVGRIELEVHRGRDEPAARRHAQHDGALVLALAAHGARARELDALRPHRRRARGADRREQRVELGIRHRPPNARRRARPRSRARALRSRRTSCAPDPLRSCSVTPVAAADRRDAEAPVAPRERVDHEPLAAARAARAQRARVERIARGAPRSPRAARRCPCRRAPRRAARAAPSSSPRARPVRTPASSSRAVRCAASARVGLVHDEHVDELEQAGLHELERVAAAGVGDEHERVDEIRHRGLGLADADRLDEHAVERGREDRHRRPGLLGDAAEPIARRHRADEHARVAAARAHPDPVAEQRAAGALARRIDRDHGDRLSAAAQPAHERVEQRRLARAGRAGHADPRAARERLVALERVEQRERLRARARALVVGEVERGGDRGAVARLRSRCDQIVRRQRATPRRRRRSRP